MTKASFELRALRAVAGVLEAPLELLERTRSFLHYLIQQRAFRPRADDLFIVTYPRSGTTWMQNLCHQLRSGGDLGFHHIGEVVPFFDPLRHPAELEVVDRLPSPRIFKTHYLLDMVPAAKHVYVARDVREVLSSCFHHARLLQRYRGTWEEFAREFLDGSYGLPEWGTWFEHVRSALERRGEQDLLFVTYAEMKADLAKVAQRVAAFWGVAVPEDRWSTILQHCSRESMRAHQQKFDPRLDPFAATDLRDFIGDGRSTPLPPEQVPVLEALLAGSIWRDAGLGPSQQQLRDRGGDRHPRMVLDP